MKIKNKSLAKKILKEMDKAVDRPFATFYECDTRRILIHVLAKTLCKRVLKGKK